MPGRIAAAALLCAFAASAQTASLEPGRPIEREIQGGDTHAYQLHLDGERYLYLTAGQRGIDLTLGLKAADGKTLVEVDRTPDMVEELGWIAAAGDYQVTIRAEKQEKPGRYALALESLRAPTSADRTRAAALQALAEARLLRNRNTAASLRQAAKKFEESLALWRTAGNRSWEAYACHLLGGVYEQLRQLPQARDLLLAALEIERAEGERSMESMTLNALGLVSYNSGDPKQALEYYEASLRLRRELGFRAGEAVTLNNLAQVYDRRGEKQQAIDSYVRSVAIRREVGDVPGEAVTLGNLSLVYRDIGQLQKALELQAQCLALYRGLGDRLGEAGILNSIGLTYSRLGDRVKAREYYRQATPLFEQIGNPRGLASNLTNLGATSYALKNYKESLGYLERALALRLKISDKSSQVTVLYDMCSAYSALKEFAKARETGEQALAIAKSVEFPGGAGISLRCLGRVEFDLGEWSKAREYLQESAAILRSNGDRARLYSTVAMLAEVASSSGDLAEALARVEEAVAIAESERTGVQDSDLRASYRAARAGQYALEVDILMRMHAADPAGGFAARALEASERSRARSLIEMIETAQVDLRQELTGEQRQREDGILHRIGSIQKELFRSGIAPVRKQELGRQLAAAERELQLYQFELRTAGSRYAAVQYAETMGPDRIRRELLSPGTALIEYALGDARSYVWALTPDGLTSAVLPSRGEIERQVTAYRKELSQKVSTLTVDSAIARFTLQSRQLYRTLVAPVEKALGGSQRLIVAPDGALAYLPFETLQGVAPLIERFAVSYAPSASTLATLQHREPGRAPDRTLLAFADPDLAGAVRSERGLELAKLPNAREEVTGIRSLYLPAQSRLYLGGEATEQALKNEDLRNYRFLHFATHGYFDEERPARSGIVLSPGRDSGDDGVLQVGEIMRLRLNSDLVTLSACQTGLGQILAGEGVLGLTRAFLYAGARSVVVSLWNVNDSATSELMKTFYRELSRGASREEALRRAKLSLMRGPQRVWRHPYFWAPFVLAGDPGSSK